MKTEFACVPQLLLSKGQLNEVPMLSLRQCLLQGIRSSDQNAVWPTSDHSVFTRTP